MEDQKAIKAFVAAGTSTAGMGPADLLVLELAQVPNLKQRLSAINFRQQLPTTTEECDGNLDGKYSKRRSEQCSCNYR